ncbi:MAG: imidazolonepropionase [Phycisphaerales bacterium]|nr:imidazolonepropionase [Phycisphaerales bacterium]
MTSRGDLLIRDARLVTLAAGDVPRRRSAMRQLSIIERGDVLVRGDMIAAAGPNLDASTQNEVDARGRVLLPGFVDCHTHACWAGDRFDEFERRLAGEDYLSILKSGGGIMSTVRATRSASVEELRALTISHLNRMLALGTTTAEVKTGYGLNTDAECRMLEAIRGATQGEGASAMRVIPTFLGAHAIDREQSDFVQRTIDETLPRIVEMQPGIACDAYCEDGAWSLDQTRRLFERAQALGCPVRIHTDQFNSLGATRLAVEMGAISVDHLEAIAEPDIALVAASDTTAVLLPISGLCTDGRYAPGRRLIDAGAAVAIASNYNPGSAPSSSLPLAMALACRMMKLLPAEAIAACTVNAAHVLGLAGRVGRIAPGMAADLVLWDERDERALCYELAGPPAALVVTGGTVVRCEI